MKKLIALLALAWSFSLQGQSVDEIKYQIEELSKRKTSLDSEIVVVTEKITAKSELLIELQTQGFVKNLTLKSNREIGVLDQKNTTMGNPLFAIRKNEEFTLLSYEDNYYFVDYNKKRGYVYYASLFGLPGTEEFKNFWDTKLLGGDSQPNQEPTKDELWIGMADSAVISVLGVPEKINCADDAFGEQEQWAYKDKLLFFENGMLTEWKSFE